jgi:ADP-heptose:LPS heptosyltransferase
LSDKPNKRILVYRTGHLGDTICAIPAFRLIRSFFAKAELRLLCDRPQGTKVAAFDVIGSLDLFQEIITYASNRNLLTGLELIRAVRTVRPDLIIMLPQGRETADMISRKKRFFYHCGVSEVRGHNFPTLRDEWQPTESNRLVQMLHSVGVRGPKPAYEIPCDRASVNSVRAKLRSVGVEAGQAYLTFCGGGKEPTQHWSLTRYARVIQAVTQRFPLAVVAIGSISECMKYQEQMLPIFPEMRFPGHLSLRELFELLRGSLAYFGNDTGPMHVAASLGCPVAAVISARHAPGVWDPDVEPRVLFRHRTECEDCFLSECLQERHRCMTGITEEIVLSGLLPFIDSLFERGSPAEKISA